MKNAIENTWRPLWEGMSVTQVASEVMARRGPSVDDSAWGGAKINEARIWVDEQVARRKRSEWAASVRTWWTVVVSSLAMLISLAALFRK